MDNIGSEVYVGGLNRPQQNQKKIKKNEKVYKNLLKKMILYMWVWCLTNPFGIILIVLVDGYPELAMWNWNHPNNK